MVGEGLHIGIILDGNRRFAKKEKMHLWIGHKYGADKVEELIGWCGELGVKELTLYSFSLENFNRPEKEKKELFRLFKESIKKFRNNKKIDEEGIRVRFIGRIEMFPKDIVEDMKDLMEETKENDKLVINFAMAYGGRQEIVDAVKKIAEKVKEGNLDVEGIDEDMITKNIYLADEPDMIIRSGGEKRVSNFLLWQSYYSEWYFTDKLWPEFTKQDLVNAIDDFKARERRFGR